MKTSKLLSLLFVVPVMSITSCQNKIDYPVEKYELSMSFSSDNFKIMQLTDIHLGIEVDNVREMKLVTKMVEDQKPDLIVVTGDSFLDADKDIVNYFVSTMESFNIKRAFTYGNHDFQGTYSDRYIGDLIQSESTKNALYIDYFDDNIYGYTNYFINILDGQKSLFRLFIIDSNSYYFNGIDYDYDVIHDDQLEHISDINTYKNDNAIGLAFFHIPLFEYRTAYGLYENKDSSVVGKGENREKVCVGYRNNGAFDNFKKNNIKATFVGHDHVNYSDLLYDGVILSYGVKATGTIYYDEDIMGCKIINLGKDNNTFGLDSIENVFYGYEN